MTLRVDDLEFAETVEPVDTFGGRPAGVGHAAAARGPTRVSPFTPLTPAYPRAASAPRTASTTSPGMSSARVIHSR